jgi:hypothetical protein
VLASISTPITTNAPRKGPAGSWGTKACPSKIRISRAATAMPEPVPSCTRVADTVLADVSCAGGMSAYWTEA